MNKHGAIMDIIIWVVMAFVITLFLGMWLYGTGLVRDQLVAIDTPVGTNGNTTVGQAAEATFGNMVGGLGTLRILSFALIFGMILTMIIGNFLISIRPVLFVPYLFINILAVVLSVPISNAYEIMLQDPAFGATLSSFTASSFILLHLPTWTTIVGILALVMGLVTITRDRQVGGAI